MSPLPQAYLFVLLAALALPLLYALWDYLARRRLHKRLTASWGEDGALRCLDAEELADAAHYASALAQHSPPALPVDDTTWGDLDMDQVFLGLDASLSVVGSEALYALLRDQGSSEEQLAQRRTLAQAIQQDPALRLKLQTALSIIGRRAFHGAWRYLFSARFQMPRAAFLYPILALLPLALLLMGFINQFFLLAAGLAFLANVFVHYRNQATWQKEAAAIRHLGAVVKCGRQLSRLQHPAFEPLGQQLRTHSNKLRAIRFFLPLFGLEAVGDMGLVLEYIKIFFMLDMVSLVAIVGIINRHKDSVQALYQLCGQADACQSIAQLLTRRQDLCQPQFIPENRLAATGLHHPLVKEAVPNDFTWQRSCLISGSNASGKSTFIKAVALNLILAQTLGLCFAQSFVMARGRVMSAMALRDSIMTGESYFVVEIKSLKRILDQAEQPGLVYCFIDEILRGTNTIERVAAASAVLASLARPSVLCLAATHDIELTRLLADCYDNRHFSETVDESGIRFDYLLKSGPTRTRNALALLAQMGYPPAIVSRARALAQRFEDSGSWEGCEE